MRVFISSTYKDLFEYRRAVIEQLEKMRVPGDKMEYFGTRDAHPSIVSIEELEACDVYLGIIGHRYGSLSPDKRRSITHLEYDRAYELFERGKMRLLLYLADDHAVSVRSDLIENDEQRERLLRFKRIVQGRHTYYTFKSPEDLATQVAADIHWLVVAGNVQNKDFFIFDADQMDEVHERFDTEATERLKKIEDFVEFIASKFGALFNLNPKQLNTHPLFFDVYDKLKSIVPGIYLTDKDGVLLRTGVRHAIMRTETLLLLLQGLHDDQELQKRGRQIGKGAATDLIEHTVKRGMLVPSSGEALVALWGFWDRTGGWGTLTPVSLSEVKQFNSSEKSSGQSTLYIKVENNFLRVGSSLEETHRLCNFWCGYIHGFFEEALPRIADLMSDLSGEKSRRVTFPAYHKVFSVDHLQDTSVEVDIFRVQFVPEPLSRALETLRDSRWPLKEKDYSRSMRMCHLAIISAKDTLGDFKERLGKMTLTLDDLTVVNNIVQGTIPEKPSESDAIRWFETTNDVLKHLAAPSRTER